MTQDQFSAHIARQLQKHRSALASYWENSGPVRHFFLDELLPEDWAMACFSALPEISNLMLRDTEKERKHVGIELERYHPLMKDILYAFQDTSIIKVIGEITGLPMLQEDKSFYAAGISMMEQGDFLMPHLDNSHDGDGRLYRAINTLYYITSNWPEGHGGNLELWDKSMKERVEIHSRFNRLVVMETNTDSIHSVSKVLHNGTRACISNYYFTEQPINSRSYIHKTTFYARPEDGAIKKLKFQAEATAKNFLSKFFNNKMSRTKHRRNI